MYSAVAGADAPESKRPELIRTAAIFARAIRYFSIERANR